MVTSGAQPPAMATIVPRTLRTPRSAAVAGILFSVLFTAGLVLVRTSMPADPADAEAWLSDASQRRAVLVVLGLVPFAGIAFLWFIAVVRDRVGDAEDRFFATVFLGSGLLFVAMLFAAAAIAAGLVSSAGDDGRRLVGSDTWEVGRDVTYTLLTVYAIRMAGVFTVAASTILRRTATGPRWLAVTGYAIAVVLLVTAGFLPWIELLFPAWVFALSLHILVASFRRDRGERSTARHTD